MNSSDPLYNLFAAPWEWDFFQALRQIESALPEYARIGTSPRLADDPVRFGQFISMGFVGTAIEGLAHAKEKEGKNAPAEGNEESPLSIRDRDFHVGPGQNRKRLHHQEKLLVNFTGLLGPNGALPLVLTEFIHNPAAILQNSGTRTNGLEPSREPAVAEFIDLFHHRLICLFYRAWALANKAVDFDRQHRRTSRLPSVSAMPAAKDDPAAANIHAPEPSKTTQGFAEWIASSFGHGLPEYDGIDSIPAWQKLAFAGHLAGPTRHLDGLRGVLAAVFDLPCEIESLTGQFIEIPEKERCRLGESARTGLLGRTFILGARFWDVQQKFTVRLGPMSFEAFQSFQPEGKCHQMLHDWINLYTRRELAWKAVIILRREDAPGMRLAKPESSDCFPIGRQLGRNAWLGHCGPDQPPVRDAHLADFEIEGGDLTSGDHS